MKQNTGSIKVLKAFFKHENLSAESSTAISEPIRNKLKDTYFILQLTPRVWVGEKK